MKNRLTKYLPRYYAKSETFEEITKVQSKEFDKIYENIEDLNKQFLVDTATWGLKIYEKELGLPIDPDKDMGVRRSIIKAKMKGIGKVDHLMIKGIVEEFTSSKVTIDFDGRIKVIFIDGGDSFISDSAIFKVVDEIKPAHLPWLINYIIKTINNTIFEVRTKHRVFNHFGRRGNVLDGEWLLNGFINLDNSYEPITIRSINRITSINKNLFDNLKLNIRDSIQNSNEHNLRSSFLISSNFWYRKGIFLNGEWSLDSDNEFNTLELNNKKDIVVDIKNKMNLNVVDLEKFKSERITIKKNWWQLGGQHSLGKGSLLNAEIREEVI